LKRDTNEMPTWAVPMHAPQTNTLWWGEEGGTTKTPLYTWPRSVGVGCLRVLMKWVEWMWNRSILSAPCTKKRTHNLGPIYFQKMMCWRVWAEGKWEGSVVQARVWCVLEARSLTEHVAGSDEGKDKHSWRCRAPIEGLAAARPWLRGGVPSQWSWPWKEDTGDVGSEASRGCAGSVLLFWAAWCWCFSFSEKAGSEPIKYVWGAISGTHHIQILNGGQILVNCKFKLNQNLNSNLYRKIPWNSNPIKVSIRLCTVRYREIWFSRFWLID